jgi:hypothetical protein
MFREEKKKAVVYRKMVLIGVFLVLAMSATVLQASPTTTITSSPTIRFQDSGDGTVIDAQTGLMWTQNANLLPEPITLYQALSYIEGMNAGTYPNFGYTDWRLPTLDEFQTLIDYRRYSRKGHGLIYKHHPFKNVQFIYFNDRSENTYLTDSDYRWFIFSYCTLVGRNAKLCYGYLWPVRGEH